MQKIHSLIKRLHGATPAGRGWIESAGRVTAGAVAPYDQASGERRS